MKTASVNMHAPLMMEQGSTHMNELDLAILLSQMKCWLNLLGASRPLKNAWTHIAVARESGAIR